MRSCLYRAIPCPATAVKLPPRTRAFVCLDIEASYPAATLAELLGPVGAYLTALPLGPATRCLALAEQPDPDTAMLLAALGVDATVRATVMLLLEGIDDAAYRALRDAMAEPMPNKPEPCRLPDDAFVGFTRTPLEQITTEAARCGLALPEPCLGVIADHFRRLGRDPWPDELLLLDEAYRAAIADPAVSAPIELITDDERLHLTYADAMAKRRVLFPDANAPATLAELSALATRYLCAHRGTALPPRRINAAVAARTLGGFSAIDGTSVTLAELPAIDGILSPDDRIVLVRPGAGGLDDAIEALMQSSTALPHIHRADRITHSLLAALGRMLGEAGLGLALTPPTKGTALTDHLTADRGLLLACAPSAGHILPDILRAAGLPFTLLGRVTRKPTLELADAPGRLCLPVSMLAPRPTLYAEARLSPKPTAPTAIPPHSAMLASLRDAGRHYACDPVSAAPAQPPATVLRVGERMLAALDCAIGADPYAAVRDTALALLARLVADGAQLEQITLSLTATLPTATQFDCGRTIAAILGLHAVQVELGLLAEPAELRAGDTLTVTLAAYAPAASTRPPRLAPDLPLWLVAPRSHAPHLDGERALLALAAAEIGAGHAVIATEALAPSAALTRAVLEADITAVLTAPAEVLSETIPCGMIVASPEMPRLPEAVAAIALGYTAVGDANAVWVGETPIDRAQALAVLRGDLLAPRLPAPTSAHPPRVSAHRIARPRVLIPHRAGEVAPTALVQTVAALGGEAIVSPLDLRSAASARTSLSAFADALDGAQLLLLGDDATLTTALLCGHRSAEAMTRMQARDGLIFAWGAAFTVLLARGAFSPDGKPIAVAPLRHQRMLAEVLIAPTSPWVDDLTPGHVETLMLTADAYCPRIDVKQRAAMLESGLIVACALGTPDGTAAVTAMTTPTGSLLGSVAPPSQPQLRGGISYFA